MRVPESHCIGSFKRSQFSMNIQAYFSNTLASKQKSFSQFSIESFSSFNLRIRCTLDIEVKPCFKDLSLDNCTQFASKQSSYQRFFNYLCFKSNSSFQCVLSTILSRSLKLSTKRFSEAIAHKSRKNRRIKGINLKSKHLQTYPGCMK
jgi:hypothetical protein